MARYTHDFQLIFAVNNDNPGDVTGEELWAALNDRIAGLRQCPDSLMSEVWPPMQTLDSEGE